MPSTQGLTQDHASRANFPHWLWPTLKTLLVVTVVVAVGWQFASILLKPEFRSRPFTLRPARLAIAAAFYVLGLSFPAAYWYLLLRASGARPHVLSTMRAYYVGQL